mgnify:CR=1 FL=1
MVSAGVKNALQAVEDWGKGTVFLDIGPTGKLLRPLGELDFEDAVSTFAEMVRAGAAAGAEAVLIETMSDIYEAKAALLAAKENSDLPVFVTMTFDEDGKLLTEGSLPWLPPCWRAWVRMRLALIAAWVPSRWPACCQSCGS